MGAQWPDPPADIEGAKAHVRYYQRLKQVMDTLKKHEDELDFFAREARAQRVVDQRTKQRGKAALNWLYEITSDYGQSIGRPLLALAVTILLFGILFENLSLIGGGQLAAPAAHGLSVVNTLGFLPTAKDAAGIDPKTLTALMRSLSVIQAALGAVFAFLIGLGLRNRFRLK